MIEDFDQRTISRPVRPTIHFEIAQAGPIYDQRLTAVTADKLAEVVEGALLGAFDIPEQSAGHAHQGFAGVEAETAKGAYPKHPSQPLFSGGRGKCVGRDGSDRWPWDLGGPYLLPPVPVLGDQDLARPQASEVLGERVVLISIHARAEESWSLPNAAR